MRGHRGSVALTALALGLPAAWAVLPPAAGGGGTGAKGAGSREALEKALALPRPRAQKALADDTAKAAAAAAAALAKHPKFAAYKKERDELLRGLGKAPTPQQLKGLLPALDKLHDRHAELFRAAYREAGADDTKLAAVLARHHGGGAAFGPAGLGGFLAAPGPAGSTGGASATPAPKKGGKAPVAVKPLSRAIFRPPYTGDDKFSLTFTGKPRYTQSADKASGSLLTNVLTTGLDEGYSNASVTAEFAVPAGCKRLAVTAHVQLQYDLVLLDGLGAAYVAVLIDLDGFSLTTPSVPHPIATASMPRTGFGRFKDRKKLALTADFPI